MTWASSVHQRLLRVAFVNSLGALYNCICMHRIPTLAFVCTHKLEMLVLYIYTYAADFVTDHVGAWFSEFSRLEGVV